MLETWEIGNVLVRGRFSRLRTRIRHFARSSDWVDIARELIMEDFGPRDEQTKTMDEASLWSNANRNDLNELIIVWLRKDDALEPVSKVFRRQADDLFDASYAPIWLAWAEQSFFPQVSEPSRAI
jgi:hypothetical protein